MIWLMILIGYIIAAIAVAYITCKILKSNERSEDNGEDKHDTFEAV